MPTPSVARHFLRGLCLTVLLVGRLDPAYADAWSQIGPDGGAVNSVAVDPVSTSTVYAGTYGGAFKSTDAGAHWSLTGLGETWVDTLAVDPQTPSTLYAVGWDVFKSTDSGGTWRTTGIGSVFSLAVDPSTPTTLFAGSRFGDPVNGGVYKSTDAGGTWNVSFHSSNGAGAVAIDPVTPSTVYAVSVYASSAGIIKTTDGGATWALISTLYPYSLAIDPDNTAIVYAGGPGGGHKSTDGGASWSAMTTLGGLFPVWYPKLSIDPTNTATIYALTGNGVAKSTDAGGTWAPSNSTQAVRALAIDPQQTANLYAGTDNGVFKSTDAGGSWGPDTSGLASLGVGRVIVDPGNSANLYAASDHGSYISSDGGTSWAGTGASGDLVIDPSNPSTVYAVGSRGLSRSTDGGATWTPITTAPDTYLGLLAVNSATLYLGGAGSLSKSTDAGATWTSIAPIWPPRSPLYILALAVDRADPKTVYVGTQNNGVIKSTDGGATWAIRNHGVPGFDAASVSVIAIDPVMSSTLYATVNDRGIIKSTDGGENWIPINAGLPPVLFGMLPSPYPGGFVTSFAIDPSNPARVYAGAWVYAGAYDGLGHHLVFRSIDGGASWTAFDVGLHDVMGAVVSLDPTNPSTLYAGTTTLSAFRRTATCAGDADCDDGNDCTIDTCDSGTDTCSHVVAADGAPCSDGFACTTAGTCRSGVCVTNPISACQDQLVPGASARGSQCTQEFFLLSSAAGGGAKWPSNHRLVCADDDPRCDFGPAGDHACTFRLSLCFNMTQPPTLCAPTDVARVRVLPQSETTTDPVRIANRKALRDAVVGLGGRGLCTNGAKTGQSCQQDSDCDTQPGSGDGQCDLSGIYFSPPLSATNTCTTLTDVKVPLRPKASGGFARGTQRIQISTSPSAAPRVVGSFTLACRPGR